MLIIPATAVLEANGQLASSSIINKPSVICTYSLTYQPDSSSQDKKVDTFILSISKEHSLFREKTALIHDSLRNVYKGLPFDEKNMELLQAQLQKVPFPSFTYSIYKDRLSQQSTVFDKIGRNTYTYSDGAKLFKWELKQDKATIAGYTCQKAVTSFAGRIWVAWFAREIPITDGPYKFQGLPGLIVQISDTRNAYVFSLLSLKTSLIQLSINPPTATIITTTKQAFLAGKAAYDADATSRMSAMGNLVTDAQKQAYQLKLKRRNNPLEIRN